MQAVACSQRRERRLWAAACEAEQRGYAGGSYSSRSMARSILKALAITGATPTAMQACKSSSGI